MLALLCALLSSGLALLSIWWPESLNPATFVFSFGTSWFAYRAMMGDENRPDWILELGGVKWNEEDFCRGWEIDGRTGSGKTASAIVPIIYALRKSQPQIGILALDTKGDLSEPLAAIAKSLQCEQDLVQVEVKPDNASADWKPPFTMNFLADSSIPYSTYAKILVDVATAAGQKGGQAFFKNAAQVAMQNGFMALAALGQSVTIENCFIILTDIAQLKEIKEELTLLAQKKPQFEELTAYFVELLKQPPEQLGGKRSMA